LKFSQSSIEAFPYVIMWFLLKFSNISFALFGYEIHYWIEYTYRNKNKKKVNKIDKNTNRQNQFNIKNNLLGIGLWISMTRHFHAIFHRH
jgi:hypothetical protein